MDPDCDPGGIETRTLVDVDLDVAPPAAGNVDDLGDGQIDCGGGPADCHADHQYTRICVKRDCTSEDLDTVTLRATGGPAGFSAQFSYCRADAAGTLCVRPPVDCSPGDCPILMDASYRATLTWLDTEAPDTSFVSPRTVVGPTANGFTAGGSDNAGVTKVQFFVDGSFKAEDATGDDGFTYAVNPGDFAHGSTHTLEAKGFDAANNADGSPAATTFTVDRLTSVDITAPAAHGHFQSPPAFSFDKDPDATATCSTLSGTSGARACTARRAPRATRRSRRRTARTGSA